jgi:hypothetical protein
VFFSIVDRQALRRGDFPSVEDLTAAISRFCQSWNEHCQPFSWTKPAAEILAKLHLLNHLSDGALVRPASDRRAASSWS